MVCGWSVSAVYAESALVRPCALKFTNKAQALSEIHDEGLRTSVPLECLLEFLLQFQSRNEFLYSNATTICFLFKIKFCLIILDRFQGVRILCFQLAEPLI